MDCLVSSVLLDRVSLDPAVNCTPDVGGPLREAVRCLNAGAPNAAVVMIRKALERLCEEEGADGKNLAERIAHLGRNGRFDAKQVALATGTRLFGNVGAHDEKDVPIDDAERALLLGMYFLSRV